MIIFPSSKGPHFLAVEVNRMISSIDRPRIISIGYHYHPGPGNAKPKFKLYMYLMFGLFSVSTGTENKCS